MVLKEFIQIKRDKATLAMMIGIPVIQLVLFGFAINTNPRHLPTALISADNSVYTRTFITSLNNTSYFDFLPGIKTQAEGEYLLRTGKVLFVVNIPPHFSDDLVRARHPQILIDVDGTDPTATGNALSAIATLSQTVFNQNLQGVLSTLIPSSTPANVIVHDRYNPELITAYNVVPGLLGVVLSLTLVFITSLGMTREIERGTMENLLATPLRPLEVIIGKVTPYILIGYCQVIIILIAAYYVFAVPIQGSVLLLLLACLPYIAATLVVGLALSTIAKNQIQSTQMATFYFLPSILLSGFLFPFAGMPIWAQYIGSVLPLTHFVIITRGILLKGNGFLMIWPQIWPLLIFTVVILYICLARYKQTVA